MRKAVRRRGQLALIGVIALASALIALASMQSPQPRVAYERGHLQFAQLIHIARACMASSRCTMDRLRTMLGLLEQLNETYPLYMYPTHVVRAPTPGAVSIRRKVVTIINETVFEVETLAGWERVIARVEVTCTAGRTYTKQVGRRLYTLLEVRIRYVHVYSSPSFNVTLCPALRAPRGAADLKRLSACEWRVGIPLELAERTGARLAYRLVDEFGIPVLVLVKA